MDKILARAARAKTQAARKAKATKAHTRRGELIEARQAHTRWQNLITEYRKTSRAEEKEDRLLGPLRQQRAVGKELETYGAISQFRLPPPVPEAHRIKYWNITTEDRVVILKGPDRHKIGRVKSTDPMSNHLVVEGCNMAPMRFPESYKEVYPDQPSVMETELPIHYNDVRLVHALRDPETGEYRDAVVANVEMSHVFHDRHERRTRWRRLIAGTDTVIPWPKTPPREYHDQLSDTKIMDVETETYQPTLLSAPLPGGVIDELRNKFGRYRTRHDEEYVVRKEAEEAKKKAWEATKVRTPVQELNRLRRVERKAAGRPELSDDMLERIGKVMAENRPQLLEGLRREASA